MHPVPPFDRFALGEGRALVEPLCCVLGRAGGVPVQGSEGPRQGFALQVEGLHQGLCSVLHERLGSLPVQLEAQLNGEGHILPLLQRPPDPDEVLTEPLPAFESAILGADQVPPEVSNRGALTCVVLELMPC